MSQASRFVRRFVGQLPVRAVAMQLSHSPLIGPGFRTNGLPVRNVDVNTSSRGNLTKSGILAGDQKIGLL